MQIVNERASESVPCKAASENSRAEKLNLSILTNIPLITTHSWERGWRC